MSFNLNTHKVRAQRARERTYSCCSTKEAEVKLSNQPPYSLPAHPRRCQFYEAPADRGCRDTQGLFLEKTLLARPPSLSLSL